MKFSLLFRMSKPSKVRSNPIGNKLFKKSKKFSRFKLLKLWYKQTKSIL